MSPATPRAEVLVLLADIKRDPDDDALRLILADWLEDHGDPTDQARAEFIRCQVEDARQSPAHPRGSARARRLEDLHQAIWVGALARRATRVFHHRGLLSLTISEQRLLSRQLVEMAGAEPWVWVEEVVLSGEEEPLLRLHDSPLLDSISSLGFERQFVVGPSEVGVLVTQLWVTNLVQLNLSRQTVTGPGVYRLLASGRLPRLRALDLGGNLLPPPAAEPLAACSSPLRDLILWGNQLGDAGVELLVQGPGLATLESLDLRGNQIGDSGAAALAAAPLTRLRELNLADNHIGPDGAAALARGSGLPALTRLVLWGNPIGEFGTALLRDRFGSHVHIA